MGSSSAPSTSTTTAKIPAWKLLREQRRRNGATSTEPTVALYSNSNHSSADTNDDELGGVRRARRVSNNSFVSSDSDSFSASNTSSMMSSSRSMSSSSLHSRSSNVSYHSLRTIRSKVRTAALDPNLPPAFRDSLLRNSNHRDTVSTSSTLCSKDSDDDDSFGQASHSDDDDSFEDESSFASLDSDADEDDDAYQQSRNRMAQQEHQIQQQTRHYLHPRTTRQSPFPGNSPQRGYRAKKTMGVHGIPLYIIAE